MSDEVPLSVPELSGNEWLYVKECIDKGEVSAKGRFIEAFERATAELTGARFAVAVSSGTAALHLALRVAGVAQGDLVIVPDFTFVAPVNAVIYCGAEPVLVDVDRTTATLDPRAVKSFIDEDCEITTNGLRERRSGKRVSAIVPVHLYGHPCDMDALEEIARRARVPIVEDAAECLGAKHNGAPVGSRARIACLSFNGNKVVTTGGGGMVLTQDESLAKRVRHLASQAKAHPTDYVHDDVGYNYRLPNLNAALGLAQVEQLPRFIQQKRSIAARYAAAFANVPGLSMLKEASWAWSSCWLNTLLVDARAFGLEARTLGEQLRARAIDCRRVWPPLHEQAPYRAYRCASSEGARWLFERGLNIPSSVGLAAATQDRVVEAILELGSTARLHNEKMSQNSRGGRPA